MRGWLLFKALEILRETAVNTGGFIDAFLSSSKSDYRALRRWTPTPHRMTAHKPRKQLAERQRLHELLYRLQQDGLIEKIQRRKEFLFGISPKGKKKRAMLRERLSQALPHRTYATYPSDNLLIISFDIPEKERRKRAWLRRTLVYLGFTMIHKSVWMKQARLPQKFLDDLESLQLLSRIHIFSIHRKGSIASLT